MEFITWANSHGLPLLTQEDARSMDYNEPMTSNAISVITSKAVIKVNDEAQSRLQIAGVAL